MAMIARIFVIGGIIITCLFLAIVGYWAYLLKNIDSVSQWDCLKVPADKIVGLGSGLQSSHQPYYIIHQNHASIELFSSSGRQCSLHLEAVGPQKSTAYEVYQASSTVSYLREADTHQRIVRVDMNTCTSKDLYKSVDGKRTGDEWGYTDSLIQFEDGFDEIVEKNNARYRVSYDQDGNQIGEPRDFHLKYMPSWTKAISPKSRSSNLVVDFYEQGPNVKTTKRLISLVDVDGRYIEQLLEFEFAGYNEFVDDVSDSSYAYCRRLFNQTIECVQFDEFGNIKYKNSVDEDSELIAVYNLKKGGVVLFTIIYGKNGKLLNVLEMRPGKFRGRLYVLTRDFNGNIFVTDFNEVDWQFSVRMESRVPVTLEYRICHNTFSLKNKNVRIA